MVLANSALLLGDIALASGNQNEAVIYWQQVNTVLGGEPESLPPRSIVVLITALKRLGEKAQAQILIEYLREAGYRHPAFLQVAD